MSVTGGATDYYSQAIHSSIGKLMDYHENLGKTNAEVLSLMTRMFGAKDYNRYTETAETSPGTMRARGPEEMERGQGKFPTPTETAADFGTWSANSGAENIPLDFTRDLLPVPLEMEQFNQQSNPRLPGLPEDEPNWFSTNY